MIFTVRNLRYAPRREGPQNLTDFLADSIRADDPSSHFLAGLIGLAGGALAWSISDNCRMELALLPSLILFFVSLWVCLSGVYFLYYAASCAETGSSLVWLPWRQRWTWAFFAFTLPWFPFWCLSLLRLWVFKDKKRPDDIL